MGEDPFLSKTMPSDDVPLQMLTLLLELLKSGELPGLAMGGAWFGILVCLTGYPALCTAALELGLVDLCVQHCRAVGSPSDLVSISRGKAGVGFGALGILSPVSKAFAGQATRPDIDASVASSLFDICVATVEAFAAAGADGLCDTHHNTLVFALKVLTTCRAHPECGAKIRGAASALAFCMAEENSLDHMHEIGGTTSVYAGMLCCQVFGRDEDSSELTFTQQQVDHLVKAWSNIVDAVGWSVNTKPTAGNICVGDLAVSDQNKPLLLNNSSFLPYLVSALLIDPEHPRASMKEELKDWCQQHHVEALAQLAAHEQSRKALLKDPTVVPALQVVVETGLSGKARELAAAALLALSGQQMEMLVVGQKHVMLSCETAAYPPPCCCACQRVSPLRSHSRSECFLCLGLCE